MEYKTRRKADTCDVARCRTRGGLTVTEIEHEDGSKVKMCNKHLGAFSPTPSTTLDDIEPADDDTSHRAQVLAIVEPVRAEATANATALAAIEITSQTMLDQAGELLKQTKAKYKSLESERTKVTKPLLDAKRDIDDWFKPAKQALSALEGVLKSAIDGFITAQEQKRLEALQLGNHQEALATEQPVLPSGISTRTVWRFNVVDPTKVPREYLAVDMAKVQAHVTEHQSATAIPGIEAYPDTSVAARS